jgi:hypothetical protein
MRKTTVAAATCSVSGSPESRRRAMILAMGDVVVTP